MNEAIFRVQLYVCLREISKLTFLTIAQLFGVHTNTVMNSFYTYRKGLQNKWHDRSRMYFFIPTLTQDFILFLTGYLTPKNEYFFETSEFKAGWLWRKFNLLK